MNRLDKALYYARKQVERCGVYVWGGQGEKLRKLTALKLAQMESSSDNAARVQRFIFTHLKQFDKNTKIYDCSGLVVMALIYAGVLKAGEDLTVAREAGTIRLSAELVKAAAEREGVGIITTPLSQFASAIALADLQPSVK